MKIKVGEVYGKWKVLEVGVKNPNSKAKNKVNMALCECQCDKHTLRYKEYKQLYNGLSLSCGCVRSKMLSERNKSNSSVKVGNIYGHLTVIEDLGFRNQSRGAKESWYKCLCSCGSTCEVSGNNLQSGGTKSCGCICSRGEDKITQILLQNNINFCKQYTFQDLRSSKGYCLKFDFAVLNNENDVLFLIEFDGRQHYYGPEATWKNSNSFEIIKEYDEKKNEYCKKKKIKLKRIPFWDIDKINFISLFDSTFDVLV